MDADGKYVPGLCAGLVLPLAELPGEIDLSRYELLQLLVTGGPGVVKEALRTPKKAITAGPGGTARYRSSPALP